jgi:hypothetical protein
MDNHDTHSLHRHHGGQQQQQHQKQQRKQEQREHPHHQQHQQTQQGKQQRKQQRKQEQPQRQEQQRKQGRHHGAVRHDQHHHDAVQGSRPSRSQRRQQQQQEVDDDAEWLLQPEGRGSRGSRGRQGRQEVQQGLEQQQGMQRGEDSGRSRRQRQEQQLPNYRDDSAGWSPATAAAVAAARGWRSSSSPGSPGSPDSGSEQQQQGQQQQQQQQGQPPFLAPAIKRAGSIADTLRLLQQQQHSCSNAMHVCAALERAALLSSRSSSREDLSALLDLLQPHLLRDLPSYQPRNVVAVAWACAKAGVLAQRQELAAAIWAAGAQQLPAAQPRDVSQLALALAMSAAPDAALVDQICQCSAELAPQFDPHSLAVLTGSLGQVLQRLQQQGPQGLQAVQGLLLQQHEQHHQEQQQLGTSSASSSAQPSGTTSPAMQEQEQEQEQQHEEQSDQQQPATHWREALQAALTAAAPSFTPMQLRQAATGSAALRLHHAPLAEALSTALAAAAPAATLPELTSTLRALLDLGSGVLPTPDLSETVDRHLSSSLGQYDGEQLGAALVALAQLPLPLPGLWEAVSALPPYKLFSYSPRALCSISLGAALAGHKDAFFMAMVGKALGKRAGEVQLADAARLLSACAKLGLYERGLFERVALLAVERLQQEQGQGQGQGQEQGQRQGQGQGQAGQGQGQGRGHQWDGASGSHLAESFSRWQEAGGSMQLAAAGSGALHSGELAGLPQLVQQLVQRSVPALPASDGGSFKRCLAALRRSGVDVKGPVYAAVKHSFAGNWRAAAAGGDVGSGGAGASAEQRV